jgi:ankyrin repeat protein
MHILAKNSSGGLMHILRRIYNQLRKRGVNCLEQDSLGNNALHYAVTSNCYDLCSILLDEGISVNEINNEGHSPLSLYMKGSGGALKILTPMLPNSVDY